MESKAAVYAVLAVALGYLLISVVPNRLVDLEGETPPLPAPAEEVYGLDDEKRLATKGVEPQVSRGGVWGWAFAFGVWMVDLLIALGIYFAVKRRLF